MNDAPTTPGARPRFYDDQGAVWLDRGDGTPLQTVRAVRARPISNADAEIAILDEHHHERMLLPGLAALDAASRACLADALQAAYLLPVIRTVLKTEAHYGNRYWDVETNHGRRAFVIKDPAVNVHWESDDRLIIRDTMGNRYEIPSLTALDPVSRAHVEKVI